MRVLLVEDDAQLGKAVKIGLEQQGYAVDWLRDGNSAEIAAQVSDYAAVLLDLGLPGQDGMTLLQKMRQRRFTGPVLIITARDEIPDRIMGLDAGADDYLGKPFAIEELLARLRALARRPPSTLDVTLRLADLEVNTASHAAARDGRRIKLTAREFGLLEYLLRNRGRVVSRAQILDHVWDDNFDPVGNVVDVLVGRLRRKIDGPGMPPLLHTVRGTGYQLSELAPDAD